MASSASSSVTTPSSAAVVVGDRQREQVVLGHQAPDLFFVGVDAARDGQSSSMSSASGRSGSASTSSRSVRAPSRSPVVVDHEDGSKRVALGLRARESARAPRRRAERAGRPTNSVVMSAPGRVLGVAGQAAQRLSRARPAAGRAAPRRRRRAARRACRRPRRGRCGADRRRRVRRHLDQRGRGAAPASISCSVSAASGAFSAASTAARSRGPTWPTTSARSAGCSSAISVKASMKLARDRRTEMRLTSSQGTKSPGR